MTRRAAGALAALLIAAVVLAGCGGGGDGAVTVGSPRAAAGPEIRIGAKNFTEQEILGQLYSRALRAQGFDVVLKSDVGSSEIIHRALQNGALDMYPEYIGVLLSEVANDRRRPRRAMAAYEAAKTFEHHNGFSLLAQTPFADSNALGVTPAFAKRHGVHAIGDLKKLAGTVRIGALAEFATRFEGLDGLRSVYGLRNLTVMPVESGGRYRALDSGAVHVASMFTSEGQLAGHRYVLLADPRGLFASGHVAPIVSEKVLTAYGPRLSSAIDAVTRVLTTPAMRRMNAEVDLQGRTAASVAAAFLRAQQLG
ncbi:MAG TPA: glycine betaine ABC transporter substrate-binding protein [Solirubrobacteraceae bacterium]|jgi:osmoprotectant transport system substrate-binding protein|nr:glycine betaine ABC transporter substrate-binding protein [Solirubrobacteraceae bacterium]